VIRDDNLLPWHSPRQFVARQVAERYVVQIEVQFNGIRLSEPWLLVLYANRLAAHFLSAAMANNAETVDKRIQDIGNQTRSCRCDIHSELTIHLGLVRLSVFSVSHKFGGRCWIRTSGPCEESVV
jgi:hypothetical protein